MSSEKVALGRQLFFETRLSSTGRYSCASCHHPQLAFTDGRARPQGATGEIVRTVVCVAAPLGTMDDGLKRQTVPEGSPPVQANVMVEWKPPDGVTVRVIGLEALPRTAVADVVEGDSAKEPTGLRILKVTEAEVLA